MEQLNENLKRKKALENRTKRFAVAVFKLLRSLPSSIDSRVIGFQLGKSASETAYWLESYAPRGASFQIYHSTEINQFNRLID